MKMTRLFGLALVACLASTLSTARAADVENESAEASKTCPAGATCSADKVAEACACPDACGACEVKSAMAKLPQLTYLVGDQETCCSESAAAMAKKAGSEIRFKVSDDQFDSKEKAMETLVSKTEAMVESFTTPATCSVSGKTTIAGKSCNCPVEAGTIAKQVQEATQLVSMKYQVGEESCSCPNAAKAMADKAGVATTYCVDGTETQCAMTARLNLARAKYKAAVTAIAKTAKAADAGSDS